MYFQFFWTIDLFRIDNELYEKYSSSQANIHKHGIRFALKILNLYAASTHIFLFVLNLDFSKLGWNSKSLLIYTDLTKHAQLKITHKKTTFSHLRSTNAVLSLSMQSLTWYRLFIIIYMYIPMVQKSLNLITWWKHEIFFHMIYDCNCLYETNCMDHYQKCKFALMICKTRCPADTNTNDVKKTCKKKIQTNPWSLAVLQILLYIIHIKIFKPSHAHVLK